jgi:hypothetical protein
MALRKLVSRQRPEPPPAADGARAIVEQAIAASPLAPARAFWDSLLELEDWWAVLIPVLLWVFWRTYKRERAAVLGQSRES